MNQTKVPIRGMHCTSCELLVEDELEKIPGVTRVDVDHKSGVARIYHETGNLNPDSVAAAVREAGYAVGANGVTPFFSADPSVYFYTVLAVGVLGVFYLAADLFGVRGGFSPAGNLGSLPVVFLVGLTAGVSTCMALVGGLVLSASASFASKYPAASAGEKFRPHLYFNLGRIVSFSVFGALIGALGSVFQLSTVLLGGMTIAVGLVMMLMGFQLTGISPRLSEVKITLPKGVARFFGLKTEMSGEYSDRGSVILGAMTIFLPCGFTQAMEFYAMSTGSPLKGALTLGVFALGTTPGLLGIGGLTAVVRGAFAQAFFRFVGVVVIAMALFNMRNGYYLAGLGVIGERFSRPTAAKAVVDPNVTVENGVQVVRMKQTAAGYEPNSFTVRKSVPVKWIITSVDANTCASSILAPSLGIRQALKPGENTFEFTPSDEGTIGFSCGMGMYNGKFTVVADR